MKLERKHIIPYLDHRLTFKDYYGGDAHEIIGISKVVNADKTINEDAIILYLSTDETVLIDQSRFQLTFKPILRPLSDFAGKRTGGQVKEELNCSLKIVHELWDFDKGIKTLEEISYELFLVMCENHIDFKKLIEKGLAIDVNTIEK